MVGTSVSTLSLSMRFVYLQVLCSVRLECIVSTMIGALQEVGAGPAASGAASGGTGRAAGF